MALTYQIEKTSRIVYLKGEEANLEEWQQTLLAVFADPGYEAGFNFLSDRRFSEKPRSADFLRAAISFLKVYTFKMGRCKWATVVSTTAAYAMARMVQTLSDQTNIEVRVFTEMDKARDWLR